MSKRALAIFIIILSAFVGCLFAMIQQQKEIERIKNSLGLLTSMISYQTAIQTKVLELLPNLKELSDNKELYIKATNKIEKKAIGKEIFELKEIKL